MPRGYHSPLAYLVPLAFQIPAVVVVVELRHRFGIPLFPGSRRRGPVA